jgi:hypothetical protein
MALASQKTVLQYVQATLSVMDSDEVDSIGDTSEATQVAELLLDVYYELINRQEWSFMRGALDITSEGITTAPTQLLLPENCKRLRIVWYNIDTAGGFQRRKLKYLQPEEFLDRFASGAAAGNRVLVNPAPNMQFYVNTDRMPSFWTSFDDSHIWCDAYEASVESTLQTNKVSAWGDRIPDFQVTDTFVPFLPDHMVPLLQATLSNHAMETLKQQASKALATRELRQTGQARRAESRITRKTYFWNRFGRRLAGSNVGNTRRWWDNNDAGGPGD